SCGSCLVLEARTPSRLEPLRKVSGGVFDQTEQAARRKQHRQHKQQADAELPESRAELREIVLQYQVNHRADEGAIKPAGAAEDQHHHHFGGVVEIEYG